MDRPASLTPAGSYIQFSASLITVAVFAGGFTFGTLLTLPNTIDNFDYISDLLSFAFLLFATALFIGISIQYLVRRHHPKECLMYNTWLAGQIHTALVLILLIAGFVILDIILINIGKKGAGIVGLALLPLIPIWYVAVSVAERAGVLRAVGRARDDIREEIRKDLREVREVRDRFKERMKAEHD